MQPQVEPLTPGGSEQKRVAPHREVKRIRPTTHTAAGACPAAPRQRGKNQSEFNIPSAIRQQQEEEGRGRGREGLEVVNTDSSELFHWLLLRSQTNQRTSYKRSTELRSTAAGCFGSSLHSERRRRDSDDSRLLARADDVSACYVTVNAVTALSLQPHANAVITCTFVFSTRLISLSTAMNWNKGGPGKKEEASAPPSSNAASGAAGSSGYGKAQQLPSFYKIGTKRANFDEENAYFEDDEEESSNVDLPYIPAENSPTRQQMQAGGGSDSEDDPLDAFMAEVENQAAKDMRKLEEKEKEKNSAKGIRDDIEEEDEQVFMSYWYLDAVEAYFRYMAENPTAGLSLEDEDENVDYDSDGNPIAPLTKKIILPLPPIDHSEIDYPPFVKNFYNEHEELSSLTATQELELRQKLNLRVSGAAPPKPCTSFAHFTFDEQLMHQIRKSEYTQPTPIQCQGVPIALSGRDMIGIAKTGSGKTAAFIWPMLVHIMDQKELEAGEGPIAIIVCPTRELCQQVRNGKDPSQIL
ncbi:ATP-dependent RNA helicase DDX42 [Liparis tanakae]|uniref:RNA helicase n=1 Tax=Liparis tanakae TaxID=230148 RepID=A0A4Z2FXY2_9TELE|nr:ATP-dependent RNA helicase DDX42 [Liparis tanakae]